MDWDSGVDGITNGKTPWRVTNASDIGVEGILFSSASETFNGPLDKRSEGAVRHPLDGTLNLGQRTPLLKSDTWVNKRGGGKLNDLFLVQKRRFLKIIFGEKICILFKCAAILLHSLSFIFGNCSIMSYCFWRIVGICKQVVIILHSLLLIKLIKLYNLRIDSAT